MLAIDDVKPELLATPIHGQSEPVVVHSINDKALVPGSVLAKALFRVLAGERVTVIQSPPGAGKTTLVAQLVRHLHLASDVTVEVLTPTNAGGAVVATKIFDLLSLDMETPSVAVSSGMVDLVEFSNETGAHRVKVSTVAAASRVKKEADDFIDVVILDEAFQTQLADAIQAVPNARQLVFVGDPGQIGPVVTSDVSAWGHLGLKAPHSPAPFFFAAREDAETYVLPQTYRLGADSARVVSDLYPFPFTSARPTRVLRDARGAANDEVFRLHVDDPEVPHDLAVMRTAAKRALDLLGQTLVEADGTARALNGADIALVASHNAQASALRSLLARAAATNDEAASITVGTADSLQGSEWPAVVAIDPLIGHADATTHSQSTGRLCVMLSRHSAHLTWVHGDAWVDALMETGEDGDDERLLGTKVRTNLMAFKEVH